MDVSFLTKDPVEGAKLLFEQSENISNNDLWNLFDFLLWEYQDKDLNVLFNWYNELMSTGKGFNNTFITGHKFVCAATIKEGDPIYRCKTCQMDGTNLLCVECFKNSDHTNHDWTPTFTPGSGCCDCGDPESWDIKGFCTNHPGPNAGENIKIETNIERVSRLLCAYIIYILSHSLSPDHYDVLYIDKISAEKSNYVNKNPLKSEPETNNTSGGLFDGMFNFGGDDKPETKTNDSDDITQRYNKFMELLNGNDNEDNILLIYSQEYKSDGDDYNEPGESENCGLGWEHPKDVCLENMKCTTSDAIEVIWKLRMYNKCKLICGNKSYLEEISNEWEKLKYVNESDPPYKTEIIKPKDNIIRIITKDILLKIIIQLKDWCSNSEILKRIIASCLMVNINNLQPDYNGLKPIGKLSVIIPPFNDEMKSEMKESEIVLENETAIYHLILNDHVLSDKYKYSGPLIDLWFALIVIPSFKERVTQIFTYCYHKMIKYWDFIHRQTQHCFIPLSVQFFTKKTTTNVCESHKLIEVLFDTHLFQSCPQFIKTYRKNNNNNNIDTIDIFDPKIHKIKWTRQWMLSKKSTHCLYDIRYLLSIKYFMEYICFKSQYDPMKHFWIRLFNLLSTCTHSKFQHRQSGKQHILMEDQSMVNILRLEHTILGTNHRYLLNSLNNLFNNIKNDKIKVNKALNMLLNVLDYGLNIINKKPYDNFDLYFPNTPKTSNDNNWIQPRCHYVVSCVMSYWVRNCGIKQNVSQNYALISKYIENERVVRMKLYNLDNGYLECPYFRADRDNFTLTLNVSKCLINISKLYCNITGQTFNELINELANKSKNKEQFNDNIFYWIDFSLQFISSFNQFHSDLLKKNGGIFATMIYNMEKPNFFSLFFTHNFYHIANNATDTFGPSNFMTLLFHRHLLYDWFIDKYNIELICKHKDVTTEQLSQLHLPLETGWKHWLDNTRVIKMLKYTLNELLAIISEPIYTLMLNNNNIINKQIIRYELIQWLIFSKFSMSELDSRVIIFGKINPIDIRPILNEIAVYEAPQNMNDGQFKLKNEFYNEFNPYYRKYGKFNEYFGTADEQSEAIKNYKENVKSINKKKKVIMFPNWPMNTKLISDSQINLLTAPFMGLIWNTILYHIYINHKQRIKVSNFQQILRLISITIQGIIENRFDLNNSNSLIENFTKHFEFRLTNKWDYINDENKDEISQQKNDKSLQKNNENEISEQKNDKYYEESLKTYNEIIVNNNENKNGIGSNVWFLCKILIDSTLKKIKHIEEEQLILIEKILTELYKLNILPIQNILTPLWTPNDGKKKDKKKKKKKLTAAEKKKLKAQKRQAKIQAKMKAKNKGFQKLNETEIRRDELMQKLEEKQELEAFGIGIKYQCIVCRSRDKQDSISMMAFATKCGIMNKLLNNNNKPFDNNNSNNKGLNHLNFSFCGHYVHKSCHDTFIKQIQTAHNGGQHYTGRGSINILKQEFCCPLCKIVCNILVPLQIIYRNDGIKNKKEMLEMEISGVEYKESDSENRNDKLSVIRKKLCYDFFKSIFCIWDRYDHSLRGHNEYINKIGSVYSTLTVCNALSYSIQCQEMNFRDLTVNSRKDRLNRVVSNINTFIGALWALTRQHNYEIENGTNKMIESTVFVVDIIKRYSWGVIQKKMFSSGGINDDNDKYCYDPFSLLCRGVVCYKNTFVFKNGNNNNMLLESKESNVVMDDIDNNNESKEENDNINDTSAIDLYKLLVSCYIMKITQLLVSYCCDENEKDIKGKIITTIKNNISKEKGTNENESSDQKNDNNQNERPNVSEQNEESNNKNELNEFIILRVIPFLRRVCILYNSFGFIDNNTLDSLWINNSEEEYNLLCDILNILNINKIFELIVNNKNKYFENYINNMSLDEINYFVNIYRNNRWDKCNKTFSLIELPLNYNDLFQSAAFSKCKRKNIRPKYSGICLICGEFVCLSCCEFGVEKRGDATRHSLQCNNGFCVFLWLQKSKIIIIWNNLGVLFKSIYLDKYGEEDMGLVRGNRITLNNERYHQLCQIITQHQIPNKLVQLRKANRDILERGPLSPL